MNWLKISKRTEREDTRGLKLVNYDETTPGYRETYPDDDLWFSCIEFQGKRCPFPFAVDLQNDDDMVPYWLTDQMKRKAILLARKSGAKMFCYAVEDTPKIAVEFM